MVLHPVGLHPFTVEIAQLQKQLHGKLYTDTSGWQDTKPKKRILSHSIALADIIFPNLIDLDSNGLQPAATFIFLQLLPSSKQINFSAM